MDKDKPWGIPTVYLSSQLKNQEEKLEKDGYKFYKNSKITIFT